MGSTDPSVQTDNITENVNEVDYLVWEKEYNTPQQKTKEDHNGFGKCISKPIRLFVRYSSANQLVYVARLHITNLGVGLVCILEYVLQW